MSTNSKSCLITLSLSSLIFSPSASLLANEIDEPMFVVGIAKDKPESIITKPLSYDMPLINEESLTKKIVSSISFSQLKPGFSKERNKYSETSNMYISPQRYGTLDIPHTTSLVRNSFRAKKNTPQDSVTSSYPFNSTGKLYMQATSTSGMSGCTASLLGRGILVTAAHCVVDYGEDPNGTKAKLGTLFPFKTWFVPAASSRTSTSTLAAMSATGPYGAWEVDSYIVPTCYSRGNCKDQNADAVGANDIAILRLKKKRGAAALPWNAGIGYYGYGWNNYGFVKNSYFKNIKSNQVTQLGYPGAIGDSPTNFGGAMIRTDTLAKDMRKEGRVTNQWGSMQTGGSSGGPIIANFGRKPNITGVARHGSKHAHNRVIGVTSYLLSNNITGDARYHRMGASIFGQNSNFPDRAYRDATGTNWGGGNIGAIMDFACAREHSNWKAGGYCKSPN